MARRGPAPQPTKLKIARGNPGRRPLNKEEPQPRQATPRCPNWLDAEAKRAWREIAPELRRIGVLTIVDKQVLTLYCRTWSRWRAAEDFIAKHGEAFPILDEKGQVRYLQQFPQVATARHLMNTLCRLQAELGLTPAGRSRIHVTPSSGPDALDRLLSKRNHRSA